MQGSSQAGTAVSIPWQISSGYSHSSPHEGVGDTEKAKGSWVWWLMLLLEALRRLRQEHCYRPVWTINKEARCGGWHAFNLSTWKAKVEAGRFL